MKFEKKSMYKKVVISLLWLIGSPIYAQQLPQRLFENLKFSMPYIHVNIKDDIKKSIVDFGGKGDGVTDNTNAFRNGINILSASGGGILEIPDGVWKTGPIVLKSNVTLLIPKNTKILFSTNRDDYPYVETHFEGKPSKRCQPNISAENQENISIIGEGTIDGSGEVWRYVKKMKVTSEMWRSLVASGGVLNEEKTVWYPSISSYRGSLVTKIDHVKTDDDWNSIKDFLRPVMIDFTSCKNIYLSGVKIVNSPSWTVHPNLCENVVIDGVAINNPTYGQNTDAIDIESCKNVVVCNSTISVGDDGVCLKSGIDEYGRKRGVPTENVIVDNCTVNSGHGGFVIGSEMSGGVRNVKVTNCKFRDTQTGLRFKSVRGRGGVVENIYIEDIEMTDVYGDAIYFDLFYGKRVKREILVVNETTPVFRNIYISGVTDRGSKRAMYLNGLPEMNLQNLVLEKSSFKTRDAGFIGDAANIHLNNVVIEMPNTSTFKIMNAKDIFLNNVDFRNGTKNVLTIEENCKSINVIGSEKIKPDIVIVNSTSRGQVHVNNVSKK